MLRVKCPTPALVSKTPNEVVTVADEDPKWSYFKAGLNVIVFELIAVIVTFYFCLESENDGERII